MKITSEGTRGEEPRAPLFSFWNSANIGALSRHSLLLVHNIDNGHLCSLSHEGFYHHNLRPFAKVFSLHSPTSPRTRWTSCKRAVRRRQRSLQFAHHQTHGWVMQEMMIGLMCKNDDEGSQPDVGKRQKCTCHLTIASHSRRSHISFSTSPVSGPPKCELVSSYLKRRRGPSCSAMRMRHATIAPFHSLQTSNATMALRLTMYQRQLKA